MDNNPKKILVIGGGIFLGRYFMILAAKLGYEITVINRGHHDLSSYASCQISCDRHDRRTLCTLLQGQSFEAVIDFCAFYPADIQIVFEELQCRWERYIYISSASVYDKNPGEFALGKKQAEEALAYWSARKGCSYTVFRPVFIYGPFNRLGREDWYFQSILKNNYVICPADADGLFQMVYVKDASLAIIKSLHIKENGIFNLSGAEVLDHRQFVGVLQETVPISFQIRDLTISDIIDQKIPVPFPLIRSHSVLASGKLAGEKLGFGYTDIRTGIRESFVYYNRAYQHNR